MSKTCFISFRVIWWSERKKKCIGSGSRNWVGGRPKNVKFSGHSLQTTPHKNVMSRLKYHDFDCTPIFFAFTPAIAWCEQALTCLVVTDEGAHVVEGAELFISCKVTVRFVAVYTIRVVLKTAENQTWSVIIKTKSIQDLWVRVSLRPSICPSVKILCANWLLMDWRHP